MHGLRVKRFKRSIKKGVSVITAVTLAVSSMSFFDGTSAKAGTTTEQNQYAQAKVYMLGTGKDIDKSTIFNQSTGYGFSDVTFDEAAQGWVSSIYNPRKSTVTSGAASYVDNATDYLKIQSRVWTETESTGYGVYTYEDTSTLNFNLENADYTVTVDLVNPTTSTLTASLESEDITKVSSITVAPGATVSNSYTACLIDGQLNLKFLETSAATSTTSESAAVKKSVYVSKVSLTKQAIKPAGTKPTVFLASDSTVQSYEKNYFPQTGWGQVLYKFFAGSANTVEKASLNCNYSQAMTYETDSVIVENRAIGGRSSKSFVEEGKLDDLLEDVKTGDYVLVQWAHNDATYSRPNRYVSTSDFEYWLQKYVDGVAQRGGIPILVTPVGRYSYNSDGTFNISFPEYRQIMLDMGKAQTIPVVDLGLGSKELSEQFGIEGSKSLFLQLAAGDYPDGAYAGGASDATHLQYYGAYKFAQIVANLIKQDTTGKLTNLKTMIPDIVVPATTPAAPTNLETTNIGASSVSMKWTGNSDSELYYIYKTELSAGQTAADADFTNATKYSVSTATKYVDSGCTGGKTYAYAVAGFNAKGVGTLSTVLTVTTKSSLYKYDFCQDATNPTLSGWKQVTSTQIYDSAIGYGWVSGKAPNNGRYRPNNGTADSNAMTDDFCLGAGEFAVDLPNGDYEVKITACDLGAGTSTIKPAYTAEGISIGGISTKQTAGTLSATVRVLDGQLNIAVGGTNAYINGLEITPLSVAPTGLMYQELAFDANNANFLLNWNNSEGAVSYNVYRKSETDTTYTKINSITQQEKNNATTMPYTALVGEIYNYYVAAVLNDGTESAPSNILQIVMKDANMELPLAPVNLKVAQSQTANMGLTWDAMTGVNKYVIYRSDRAEGDKGFKEYTKIGENSTNSYTDTDADVTANVVWYYKVAAMNAGGLGAICEAAASVKGEPLVQQAAESLSNRALVAVNLAGSKGAETRVSSGDSGIFLSWRSFEADVEGTSYTIYKNDKKLIDVTLTNYLDTTGIGSDVYKVVGNDDAALGLNAQNISVWGNQYLELNLDSPADQTMPDGTICTYQANDMSVGDLDGDGDYELIVKWQPDNSKDNSAAGYTGTTILDAYNVNMSTGTAEKLWRIDLGINIRSGAHYTQFQVWDLDGDGKSEIMCKTADGTVDGLGVVIGTAGKDYRNTSGYILEGPEYLTVFNGETGKAIDTIDYKPGRGSVAAWGDPYGNRVDRFLSGVAYLDGVNPYAVFCRGYYTRTTMTAYSFSGGKLHEYWAFDTANLANGSLYEAQGDHQLSINDIDQDGKDEIIYGSLVIDNDGTVKYCTEFGHGDAMHVSDFIPWNEGLEIMQVHEHAEAPYHVEIHDAETGKMLVGFYTGKDTGRGIAADVDPRYAGAEYWSIAGPTFMGTDEPSWDSKDGGMFSTIISEFNTNVKPISPTTPASNFSLLWDGDLMSETFDHSFDTVAYKPLSINITDWNYETQKNDTLLSSTEALTDNGTKGNPGLIADLLGDWREEVVVRSTADDNKIRIYTTTIATDYVVPCLMENHTYRTAIAWQNVGYNQPAHTDYLLSEGLITAQLKKKDATQNSATILFSAASDGVNGDDVTGYEVYRADASGTYEKIKTIQSADLIETDEEGTPIIKVTPVDYKFDFGAATGSATQAGWTQIKAANPAYDGTTNIYGFTSDTIAKCALADKKYTGSTDANLADVYNDCVLGWNALNPTSAAEFDVKVPNGTYEVAFYVRNGSGQQYNLVNIEGTNLTDMRHGGASIVDSVQTVTVVVTDGVLNIVNNLSKAATSALYFSGLTIHSVQTTPDTSTTDTGATKFYSYTDTGLSSNTTYQYKIAAIVDAKTSFKSSALSIATLIDIKSINDFTLNDIAQDTILLEGQTVADLLPKTLSVIDQNDKITSAKVTWDVSQVYINTAGAYTVTGTVEGYAQLIKKTLQVVPNKITSYDPLTDITAVVNTSVNLPVSVNIHYLNTTTKTEIVTWDTSTYDFTKTGNYTVKGTTESLAEVKVNLIVKDNYVVSVNPVNIVEAFGKKPGVLPGTVSAVYADGTVNNVAVTWNGSPNTTILGTAQLSGSIAGYVGTVTANVTVENAAVAQFDFGISATQSAAGWTTITLNAKGGTATMLSLGSAYSSVKGYGFLNAASIIQGRDEGVIGDASIPTAVSRDFALPAGETFAVDLPNGSYIVEVVGSSSGKSTVKVTIEKNTMLTVGNAAGVYAIGTQTVQVEDGQMSFVFDSTNATRIAAIRIRKNITSIDQVEAGYITLNNQALTLKEKSTSTLTADTDLASTDSIKWTSSNENIAKVDGNGVVTAVSPGTANIKITSVNKTAVCVVTVLPNGKPNGDVEIKPNTPVVTVGNLAEQFDDSVSVTDNTKGFTDADKKVVTDGGNAEIKLTVETKAESAAPYASNIIIAAQLKGETVGTYLDFSVLKTVTTSGGIVTETSLIELPSLIEIQIPLDTVLQGKTGYVIYRYHGTGVDAITTTPNADGEKIEMADNNKTIKLFIKKFSTYAIAYKAITVEDPTVEIPTVEIPTVEPPTVEPPTVETPTVQTPTAETPTQTGSIAADNVSNTGETTTELAQSTDSGTDTMTIASSNSGVNTGDDTRMMVIMFGGVIFGAIILMIMLIERRRRYKEQ